MSGLVAIILVWCYYGFLPALILLLVLMEIQKSE